MHTDYKNLEIIVLGGNSRGNKQWVASVASELGEIHASIVAFSYSHWNLSEETIINLDSELYRLRGLLKDKRRYVFVGKSAGALLVLKGVYEKKLFPLACIFLGTAVLWGRENSFKIDDWLKEYSVPTLFIQKEADPAIGSDELSVLLKKKNANRCRVSSLLGDTHEYTDYQQYGKLTKEFLRKSIS